MTELGKSVIPMSQIPVATLYKKTSQAFLDELEDENIAELHFNHHSKRRVKNLLRLNVMIKLRGNHGNEDNSTMSMPSLQNSAIMEPSHAYGTQRVPM